MIPMGSAIRNLSTGIRFIQAGLHPGVDAAGRYRALHGEYQIYIDNPGIHLMNSFLTVVTTPGKIITVIWHFR